MGQGRWRIFPDSVLSVVHDGEGWLICAERPGEEPFLFGAYAETAKDAQWAAEQCGEQWGNIVQPLQLQ